MKKIYFIFAVLCSVSVTLMASGGKWHSLKAVGKHNAKSYTLAKNVARLELRSYDWRYEKRGIYTVLCNIEASAPKVVDPKIIKKFTDAKPNLKRGGDMGKSRLKFGDAIRGFVLYANGKISRLNEVSDIIKLFGKIDTPAEAQLIIHLSMKYSGIKDIHVKTYVNGGLDIDKSKYRKTSKGYEIWNKYTIYSGSDPCTGLYDSQNKTFIDRTVVNKNGKIILMKQLSKKIKKSSGGELFSIPPVGCYD
jgi:hypothetical protein